MMGRQLKLLIAQKLADQATGKKALMADDHIVMVADEDHNHLAAAVDHIPLVVTHKAHADHTQGPATHRTLVARQ